MSVIDLRDPVPSPGQGERLARLTRHLKARLEDFGPGGPEVVRADQEQGLVAARFPGHSPDQVIRQLEQNFGLLAALEGDCALFRLSPQVRFEDLDYLWGCLYELL